MVYRIRQYSRILGRWEYLTEYRFTDLEQANAKARIEQGGRWTQVIDQDDQIVYDLHAKD